MAAPDLYIGTMDDDERKRIALWRFGVLGPLVSARLEHGDRRAYFEAAASRLHARPDGRLVRLSARTIEAWFYAYRSGGLDALARDARVDRGKSRAIAAPVAEFIVRMKREKPRRSIRRIIRALERAKVVGHGDLSRSSVHRLLQQSGISARPLRGPAAERRSFITEHAGDLWIGDALHGPRVLAPDGRLRKAFLFSQIDCATRFLPHSYLTVADGESAVLQEAGLRSAVAKYGPPRAYYVDRGAAYIADSLKAICPDMGTELRHAGSGDAEAKGAIERWHRTWREEVEDELEDGKVYTLEELSERHLAWLDVEYHARTHETTGRAPRDHWLGDLEHLRALPVGKTLEDIFLHREQRRVRKDGTVRFRGSLLEVRPELSGAQIELRFDPTDPTALPRVFAKDTFYCDTVPLDRLRNSMRARRRDLGAPEPSAEPSGIDPLGLILREHRDRTRPFGAPDSAALDETFRRLLEDDSDDADQED